MNTNTPAPGDGHHPHLSDFRFDRLLARELDGTTEGASARAHLQTCPACADRYRELERQAADFREQAGRRRLAEAIVERAGPARRRWPWVAGLTVSAACALLLLLRPHPSDDLRAKGSLGFEVWVLRQGAGAPESLVSPATVSPGDALRFRAATPTGGYVAIAGIDATGAVSAYVPAAPGPLPPIGPGTTLLDGAVALDGTLGPERLVALVCPAPLETSRVIAAVTAAWRAAGGNAAALDVGAAGLACAHGGFSLVKVPAR